MDSEFYNILIIILKVWGIIFYLGYGIVTWLLWDVTGRPTKYLVLEFILLLPVTGVCWLVSKGHNFIKEELFNE